MKLAVVLGAALCAVPAFADFDADSYPAYETCALCHGLEGQSRTGKFPHLAGQKPAYIEAQLTAFLGGLRTNDGGQMASIVTELSPEDIPVVVQWFSQQPPPSPAPAPVDETGAQLVASAGCLDCHGAQSAPNVPHIAAQHSRYLAKQMRDFRDGLRSHSPFAEDHQIAFSTMEDGIDQIAAYLASRSRDSGQ